MGQQLSEQKIIHATLESILDAHTHYQEMNGDKSWWLRYAPEYFLTVRIAESIFDQRKQGNIFVSLEYKMDDILDNLGKGSGRVPKKIRKDGRSDIVLWNRLNSEWSARAIIEVKNQVSSYNENIRKDIERIGTAVKKYPLQFGLFAFYTSVDKNKEHLRGIIKHLRCKAEETIRGISPEFPELRLDVIDKYVTEYVKKTEHSYCAVVFHIKKR
ncbi:MAG: hypothetical protein LBU53_00945 [Zoogloeaceae bacterium]|jgi:hypothetical protein|nr:hypothetical protein [Zoogloeaceae bacterium]